MEALHVQHLNGAGEEADDVKEVSVLEPPEAFRIASRSTEERNSSRLVIGNITRITFTIRITPKSSVIIGVERAIK